MGWLLTSHLLSALSRLGSRLCCLSLQIQSVCCTLSSVSNHRNLLIAVSVASYYFVSEGWHPVLRACHLASVKQHWNEPLSLKLCYQRNRIAYPRSCYTFNNVTIHTAIKNIASNLTLVPARQFSAATGFAPQADSLKLETLSLGSDSINLWMMSFRVTEPKAVMATRRAN